MQKLHICLVSQQFGEVKSGVGVYTRNLAEKLLADGHEVTLICPQERAARDLAGLSLVTVSGRRTGSSHIRWLVCSRRFGKALKKLLAQQNFHLIHFTDAREALFCPTTDVPVVGNMNDYYFAAAPRSPWAFRADYVDWPVRWAYYHAVRLMEGRALGKLSAIICNSRHTRDVLAQAYGLPLDRLTVIYKSIDVSRYHFRPQPAEPDGRRVLFVGGNVQRKGLPTLIRAAPAVLQAYPQTEFMVVGDNQNLDAMKNLCRREAVADSFRFLGWQSHDEIQEHYGRAAVFVMPSLIEAFGIVFLEAMACGVPVIGGNVGGTRELIQDGVNGLLVEPRDHRSLALKIVSLFADEERRQRLIRRGRETAQRYGVESMVSQTYQLYQKLFT